MIQELLSTIGLSDKESTMYITLLRHGIQPTSMLAKRAGFNRGTAYVVLHSLLEKGLAVKTTRRKIQYFAPLDPGQLIHYIDHQQQELQDKRKQVQSMMSQLLAITNPLTKRPKMEYFDGAEGARFVLSDTLTAKEKILRAYLSIADVSDFAGSEFFHDYTNRRIKKGYALHAIRTLEKDRMAFASDRYAKMYVTSEKQKREVRHVSDELAFPISMYIYDEKIAIVSSKEENFALLIESRELAEMQKKLFELLWASLKR